MTTMVNFRMEEQLKNDMDKLCDNIGLSMSAAFIIFAKKFVNEKRMPFDITENSESSRQKFLNAFSELRNEANSTNKNFSEKEINNIIDHVRKKDV